MDDATKIAAVMKKVADHKNKLYQIEMEINAAEAQLMAALFSGDTKTQEEMRNKMHVQLDLRIDTQQAMMRLADELKGLE